MTTSSLATHTPSAAIASRSAALDRATGELKAAAVVTIGFGLLFAVGAHDATDAPVRFLSDVVFWRLGDGVVELTRVNHLADAILGGVMAGWGVMIWMLANRLLPVAPVEVKRMVTTSALVWFAVDTGGSIASGGWFNGVLNLGFLAMFLAPLRRI